MKRSIQILGVVLLLSSLVGCVAPDVEPTLLATVTSEPGDDSLAVTAAPTPDSCTGWQCTVTGLVYAGQIGAGNEFQGALVTLDHSSNCSPTRGEHQATTGPDGTFEFQVFFHDTDMVRLWVEAEGFSQAEWDSRDIYCYYCSCWSAPLEIVLVGE
jgi:hypothetical protein